MVRVLIADDHAIVREGLSRILSEEPLFDVVGEASDSQEALDLAKKTSPDVVLLDISMPGRGGIETLKE
ncbi:MAG TPA: response regulator transcription factor, partial [Thermoanaerobaculia bacterium]|nr:response regulator transcription factor [Thermoanaerobaculia bacterium]